jgi:hypothetical protein
MIDPAKYDHALRAVHRALLEARLMAYKGEDHSRIADFLDWAELLPKFIAVPEDKTVEFRETLVSLIERRPDFRPVLDAFDRPEQLRW